jgi:uncharacterized membrane protein YgdD (TMEM256/DUF423 family)
MGPDAVIAARVFLAAGALALALAVAMGAVSAHAAKNAAHPEAARLLQTALLYQLVHGLGIVLVAVLMQSAASRWLTAAGLLHMAGIACFCGSLYVLAYTGRSLGPVAPLGGLAFIGGWLALAVAAFRE